MDKLLFITALVLIVGGFVRLGKVVKSSPRFADPDVDVEQLQFWAD